MVLKNKLTDKNEPPTSVVQEENPEGRRLRKRLIQSKSKGSMRQRLSLLLWKNLLLRRRHWITTAFEILLPTLVAIILAYIRTQIVDENPTISLQDTVFPVDTEAEIISEAKRHLFKRSGIMAYVPQNNLTDHIMAQFKDSFRAKKMIIMPFATEEELEKFAEEKDLESASKSVPKVQAAIVFGDTFSSGNLEDFGKSSKVAANYKLRLAIYTIKTTGLTDYIQFPGPSDDNAYSYKNGGFTGLQILFDKILIKMLTKKDDIPFEFQQQVFPYPPFHKSKGFEQFNSLVVPLFMIIGFIFIVPATTIKVVSERETGIKELMKIMGLPNWIHWLGWMINSLLALAISITIVVFMFFFTFNETTGPVLPYSDPVVWWIVLFLYVTAATAFCFLVSAFSDQSTTATALGIVLWLVSYFFVALPMEFDLENVTLYQKLASCLLPNVALHWAIKVMYAFETRGVGATWATMFKPASLVDGLALYHILIMLIIDTIIYWSLTVYLENILPSKYGIRKPWYYIFMPSTWCSSDTPAAAASRRASLAAPIELPGFEKEPVNLPVGVAVQNLSKIFGKKKSVNGVCLKMYEGQITALVGHNGAGKTTTLSILTGMFPPTSGTASVSGYDIQTELDKVRESLGLCPQHNMLFDKLTVYEHLILFGRLKGLNLNEAQAEARQLVLKLDLKQKKHYMSCELSGGQKRKLSLGMALIGGSKVVILDECTSGMDPEARRVIWDLLLELRGERTIILTTHFMEEADILGDRIAMMAAGKIKCCGTPLYLKKYFGAGYTLKLTTSNGFKGGKEIINVVQTIIPEAESMEKNNESNGNTITETSMNENEQTELSISIPNDEETISKFPSLFSKLNGDKANLGILTIGLSLTTIDQVFLKIGEMEAAANGESHPKPRALKSKSNGNLSQDKKTGFNPSAGLRRPRRILMSQLIGLFRKKYLYTLRQKKLLVAQFIIPPILLISAVLLSTVAYQPGKTQPPLPMNISMFKEAVSYFTSYDDKLGGIYSEKIGPSARQLNWNNTDMIQSLLDVSKDDLGAYRDQYMIAAEINETLINAMYNSIPYHTAPVSLNLATNTILKFMSPPDTQYSLEVTNHPLQNDLFNTLTAALNNPAFTFIVPVAFGCLVPIGLALFAASYVVFPTEERLSQSKQLQLMTGVSPFTFWGTSFIWDFFIMAIAICVMVIWFPIFETNQAFTGANGIWSILLILLAFGYSAISFSYLVSLFVPSASGGFAFVTIFHVLFGMICPIIMFFLDSINLTEKTIIGRYVLRLTSSFPAALSIMRFTAISTANSRCTLLSDTDKSIICNATYQVDYSLRQCCENCLDFLNITPPDKSPCFEPSTFFNWNYTYVSPTDAKEYIIPGIGQEMMWVVIMALVYQLCIFFIESGLRKKIMNLGSSSTASSRKEGEEDVDVIAEKERVHQMTKSDDALVVSSLSKNYGGFAAVKELNFGVHYGECFGLLGVNGAGKTTSFRMLTGDEILTSGNAYGFNKDLRSSRTDFLANIGYCPQFDAIIGALAGKEMLELFCYLRGVPSNEVKHEVDKWLHKLGLEQSANVPCGQYSGGMKRRLNVGIAMIGDPPVVLLDEPTSGVDPVSRRQFWDVIDDAKQAGQSVILTSHSMDEIEVLCSRLGIMVNGQLQCLGSVEYLRNKFAHGFTLVLRLHGHHSHDSPLINHLKAEMAARFQPCELQDEHQNILQYQLMDSKVPWDVIFQNMEDLKKVPLPEIHEVVSEKKRSSSPSNSGSSSIDSAKTVSIAPLSGVSGDEERTPTYGSLIEDYTVSLTSLEEVFLAFARKQYSSRDANLTKLRQILLCKYPCCVSD